jgi:hypothetical protein
LTHSDEVTAFIRPYDAKNGDPVEAKNAADAFRWWLEDNGRTSAARVPFTSKLDVRRADHDRVISLDIANIELCAGNLLDPIAVSFKAFHGIKSAIKVRIEIL